jgi:dihydroorotase
MWITGAEVFRSHGREKLDVHIHDGKINALVPWGEALPKPGEEVISATGKWIMPGAIDDQVHFREPGLTHKGNLISESKAAVAGGITSFMEMPNTKPPATTQALLAEKYALAEGQLPANYSFFMGTSNDNLHEILKTDLGQVCGLKIFMGSSTGGMLVDKDDILKEVFRQFTGIIALHCESEEHIRRNSALAREKFGDQVPVAYHPIIRDAEACYASSARAVELATKYNTHIHILHISTEKELSLFQPGPLENKRITSEACIHHLWFTQEDYQQKGSLIKWNPAVKAKTDRDAIRQALLDGRIDVIATDHAPHTIEEKQQNYFDCPSGAPMVQHSVQAMLELTLEGWITPEQVVDKMAHQVARLFKIKNRGFIDVGFQADLILVNPNAPSTVTKESLIYKCGWSPMLGQTFQHQIETTWVNGIKVWNQGQLMGANPGMRMEFDRH